MVSSSATQNQVAEDGSLSPKNLPVKENNLSINSIILRKLPQNDPKMTAKCFIISFYSGKQKIFSQTLHGKKVKLRLVVSEGKIVICCYPVDWQLTNV